MRGRWMRGGPARRSEDNAAQSDTPLPHHRFVGRRAERIDDIRAAIGVGVAQVEGVGGGAPNADRRLALSNPIPCYWHIARGAESHGNVRPARRVAIAQVEAMGGGTVDPHALVAL